MSIFTNISRAVNNLTKNVQGTVQDIKKAEQKAFSGVKNALGKVEDKLKGATKGIKNLGKNMAAVGGYAPLLPYYLAMKNVLKRRGIRYDNNIVSVSNQFLRNVVMRSNNYESFEGDNYDANTRYFGGVDVPVYPQATYVYNNFEAGVDTYCYDLQYNVDGDPSPMAPGFNDISAGQMEAYKVEAMQAENPAAGQGFDPNNMIGKGIGALVGGVGASAGFTAASGGTAVGGAPVAGAAGGALGGAVGGGVEGVVKAIIKWFGALLKAKKEGKNLGEFADAAADATRELANTTAEEAAAMEATGDAHYTGVGDFVEKNKTMVIVLVVVVLAVVGFMVFRKK